LREKGGQAGLIEHGSPGFKRFQSLPESPGIGFGTRHNTMYRMPEMASMLLTRLFALRYHLRMASVSGLLVRAGCDTLGDMPSLLMILLTDVMWYRTPVLSRMSARSLRGMTLPCLLRPSWP